MFEEGSIVIGRPKKGGFSFIPAIPCRTGDATKEISDGMMMKVSRIKTMPPDVKFYEMQIIVGPDQGDMVLIPVSWSVYMEEIPSKRQPR